ncbi:aldo/keto reductase [Paenibacillus sp. SN-8-1]|uniref:aldo/keto reductase n=1 Tax=Paenibacillus sp. SN-8-1 TaxID=3435409 RepID=UPI003D9A4EDA
MKYTYLGKSGLAVSSLCLGTMTFGGTTDEKDSKEMIHRFLDQGGNFIDTADVYTGGRSEEIVGKSIRGRRSEVILASKVRMSTADHVNGQGSSRKHIMDGIEASLRRLGTDYIDLYQIHVWDQATPVEETLRALDDLVTSGKVRYIGCSNYLSWQLMKSLAVSEARGLVRYVSLQQQYSLLNREADREMMSLCFEENVGIIPWAPLGGGFLTNRYKEGPKPSEGRLSAVSGGESSWEYRATKKNFDILNQVVKISKEIDRTPSQVALNWLMGHKGITSPIFGASTLEQFDENMGAVDFELDGEQRRLLDEVSSLPDEYPDRFIRKFKRQI